ncbi:MAG: hypothetical protein QMC95_16285 [Desulfitobacteriaceae bacterium]|nr:hypothetical protein [Desulfitobacteriaceae bacterium]MDI6915747.1 hypothetical protein [Desulfitobacteriaceae bacterium]
MCGIAGFMTKGLHPKTIFRIYTELLVRSVRRGYDATGVAVTLASGKISVAKGPIVSPRFVEDPVYQEVMSRQPIGVIGHTRAATKGSPKYNRNNHPLIGGNIVGVHNGGILNEAELTQRYHLSRKAEVDSEVIFALLDRIELLNEESIRQTLSLLEGTYALAFQNGRDPQKIWLVRGPGRPLVVGYDTRLETTWFASESAFILKAYKTTRIKTKDLEIHEMREGEILSLSQSSIEKRQKMV